ncbi:ParB N-terminal domain-containing protein [Sphingobium sufflavum]|uniref:hypothetical protein n=1 Tax=Sphingobium sufflavum TaxID=1129547 RepID=UPI002277BF2A|nr:hypothetical protein [Sphingobium sufflavum]
MREVDRKAHEWRGRAQNEAGHYLGERMIPAVIGPDKRPLDRRSSPSGARAASRRGGDGPDLHPRASRPSAEEALPRLHGRA